MDIGRYLGRLEDAKGLNEIQSLVEDLRTHFAVNDMVYHWVSSDGEQYGFGTYSSAWAQRYVDQDYLRIDPVILACFHRFHPVNWAELDWSTKPARRFLADALEHNVGPQGLSIPIRGPNGQFALLTVSDDRPKEAWRSFVQDHQRELILIAYYFNQKALELGEHRTPDKVRALSPREVDALTFLGMGYNRAEISDMISISEHTLRAHIESARKKLGAANTIHAVSRAIAEGLIIIGGTSRAATGDWPGRDLRPQA